jgi:hypothetical protein
MDICERRGQASDDRRIVHYRGAGHTGFRFVAQVRRVDRRWNCVRLGEQLL